MPRRKGKKPGPAAVSAAVEGSKEVVAELTGNPAAAKKFGNAEKTTREGMKGKTAGKPARTRPSAGETIFSVTRPTGIVQPVSTLPEVSGTHLSSYAWNDPFASSSPGLYVLPDTSISYPKAISPGTGATAHAEDNIVSTFVGQMMDQMYARAARMGLSITNYNSTGTIEASWATFWQNWIDQYRAIQGLRAMSAMYGYNIACSTVATVINNNLPRIDSMLNRLIPYPMPPSLYENIMKTHGVFLSGNNADPPIWSLSAPVTLAQLDVVANIANYLTGIDSLYTAMVGISNIDLANITRVLNQLWKPQAQPVPQPRTGDQHYQMMRTQGIEWSDGATNSWNAPSLDNTGVPNVPMLFYGDLSTVDPIWTTLFRPVVTFSDNNSIFVKTSLYGVFQMFRANVTNGSEITFYAASNGAFGNASATQLISAGAAAATVITPATGVAFDFPWAPIPMIKTTSVNELSTDFRSLPGFQRMYVPLADLMRNTEKLYGDMFILG